MTIINLYKNGNAIGPHAATEGQAVHAYRLVADEGKMVTDGKAVAQCIDIAIADVDRWSEIDDPGDDEEITWEEAGKILAGEGGEDT